MEWYEKDILLLDFDHKFNRKDVNNLKVIHIEYEAPSNINDYLFVIVLGKFKINTDKFVINIAEEKSYYDTTIISSDYELIVNMLRDSLFRPGYITIGYDSFRRYLEGKTWYLYNSTMSLKEYSSMYICSYTSEKDSLQDIVDKIEKLPIKVDFALPIIGGNKSYDISLVAKKKIKNIVFDLGGVLLHGKAESVLEKLDYDPRLNELLLKTFFKYTENLDLGFMSLKNHFDSLDIKVPTYVREDMINYYKFRDYNKDMIKLMNRLSEMYNIYILSNNNNEVKEYIMNKEEFKCVKGFVVSCDYHTLKPDSSIYNILFDNYNINPEESYFIDDKKENIETSRRLGMRGTILNYENDGVKKLLEDLRKVL